MAHAHALVLERPELEVWSAPGACPRAYEHRTTWTYRRDELLGEIPTALVSCQGCRRAWRHFLTPSELAEASMQMGLTGA